MLSSQAKRELKINQRRILIDSIEMRIPSSQQIKNWGERQLPNGKKVGQVKNSKTVNYKKFTPLRDGLFCERIFGPVNSFVCACGKRQPRVDIKFCEKCEVEYADQRTRRYRLGYIPLVSSAAHIWYLKGRPSYLSIFLGKRKKRIVSLVYCNAYLIEQAFSVMTALPHVTTRQNHGFSLVSNSIKGSIPIQQFSDKFDFLSKRKAFHQSWIIKGQTGKDPLLRKDFFLEKNPKNKKASSFSQTFVSFPTDFTKQSQNKSKVTSFFRFLREVIDTNATFSLTQNNPHVFFKQRKKNKISTFEQNVVSSSSQSALAFDKKNLSHEIDFDKHKRKKSVLFHKSLQLFSNIAFYLQKQKYNFYQKKSTVSFFHHFKKNKNNFVKTNENTFSFQQNFVKMCTLSDTKTNTFVQKERENSIIQKSTYPSFFFSEYKKYISTISESKQSITEPYDRAQSLPFLPTLICKYNLRDELLNFLDSSPSLEDIPLPGYCQIGRWQPLRDVHKFMAEQPFYQKRKKTEKNSHPLLKKSCRQPFQAPSAANFVSVKSDDEAKNWTTKRKIFLFSPYTLSYLFFCQTLSSQKVSTNFLEFLKEKKKYHFLKNRPNPQIEFYTNRLLHTVYTSVFTKQEKKRYENEFVFDTTSKKNPIYEGSTSHTIPLKKNSHALDSSPFKALFSPLSTKKTVFSHFLVFPQTLPFQNIKEIEFSSGRNLKQFEKEKTLRNNFYFTEKREFSKKKATFRSSSQIDFKKNKKKSFPLIPQKKMDEKNNFDKKQIFQQNQREFFFNIDSIASIESDNESKKIQEKKRVNFHTDNHELSYPNKVDFLSKTMSTDKGQLRYRVNGPLNFAKQSLQNSFFFQESHASSTERKLQKIKSKDSELLSPLEFITIREILSYTGGGALEKLLKRFDTQLFSVFLTRDIQKASEAYKQKISLIGHKANRNEKKVLTRLCRRIFRNARRLKVVQLFTKNQRRPEWMMISTLPVLPPDLRPILQMSESLVVASDLNNLYQRVIYRNNRYHKLRFIDFHLVTAIQRLVQDAVDRLIENGKGGSKPFYTPGGRPLKSLSDTLKGKKGRFRLNLLGKRVDFSGRSVIVVSPHLKIHECGLPKAIALELYHYFLLRNFMVKRKASSIVIAKKMIKQQKPAIWDMLRDIIYHHPLLLNRAPTLHRLGIQAFQPKLVLGNAILLHPLVCSGFNADFDGDQMGVHLPLCLQARAEAWDLLWSRNNLLSPATGQPVLIPSQDMVLGFYYMTQLFADRLLVASDRLESHNAISTKKAMNFRTTKKENTFLPASVSQSDSIFLRKRLTRIPSAHKVSQSNKLFFTQDELIHAFQIGNLNLHTPVWLKSQLRVENDEKGETPLELRMTTFGGILQIYSQYKRRKESTSSFSSMYIRTTVGRVLVNEIIFSKKKTLSIFKK